MLLDCIALAELYCFFIWQGISRMPAAAVHALHSVLHKVQYFVYSLSTD